MSEVTATPTTAAAIPTDRRLWPSRPALAVDARGGRPSRVADDESLALIVAAVAFASTAIVATPAFWGRELPIGGRSSVGEFTAIAGAVVATAAFAIARLLPGRDDASRGAVRYRWFDLTALSIAHGAIALLAWIGLAAIMEHSFVGATVYGSPAAVLAAGAVALSGYLAFLSGRELSPRQLSLVLAVFLVVGTVTAMLSASDPNWWQSNLSALGVTHDVSALTFNLTVIVSGVIVTTIARLGTSSLPARTRSERNGRTIVRALFVLLGVLLACVGIFPVDRFLLVYNTVATGMTIAFAALVLALPWLVPSMPRLFLVLGYVFVLAIVVLAALFALGSYNLTAVELVSALLIFAWIILFLRNAQRTPGR